MTPEFSDDIIDFIAAWEGFKAQPAPDRLVSTVWDIGHGHVLTQADREHAILGRFYDAAGFINLTAAPLTRVEARKVLIEDLFTYAECVYEATEPFVLSENERDACLSLCYNIGCKAFANSTLARKIREGNPYAALDEFHRWHRAAGRLVPGLVKRRNAEIRIFQDAQYDLRP